LYFAFCANKRSTSKVSPAEQAVHPESAETDSTPALSLPTSHAGGGGDEESSAAEGSFVVQVENERARLEAERLAAAAAVNARAVREAAEA